eukprot:1157872-Pelagomonas_calceolata.AAC.5
MVQKQTRHAQRAQNRNQKAIFLDKPKRHRLDIHGMLSLRAPIRLVSQQKSGVPTYSVILVFA